MQEFHGKSLGASPLAYRPVLSRPVPSPVPTGDYMPRGYANHVCVHCQERQSIPTGDHVFARAFLPDNMRENLPIAPACEQCNTAKSKIEVYLTVILPFGGRDMASEETQRAVKARLNANQRLIRELREGFEDLGSAGAALPLRGEFLREYFEFAARGLIWHHWRRYLPQGYGLLSLVRGPGGQILFDTIMSMGAKERVVISLGDGHFTYEGVAANDDPNLTAWKFDFFDGMLMAGDPSAPDQFASGAGVITAPADTISRYKRHLKID